MKIGLLKTSMICVSLLGSFDLAKAADCIDPDLSKIPTTQSLMLCNGTLTNGTWAIADCSSDAQTGCVTTAALPAADTINFDPYNLRFGITVGGVTGKLKRCRNVGRNAIYNNAGLPGTGASNAAGSADPMDWWDATDDFGNGTLATNTITFPDSGSSTSEFYCDGSQISDVTSKTTSLVPGATLNCSGAGCTDAVAWTKILYEPYTKLFLTNVLLAAAACGGAGECTDWSEAVSGCYNLNSGDGTGKWRLPTQKEMMALASGGIYHADATFFGSQIGTNAYWTATTQSSAVASAWYTTFHAEDHGIIGKNNSVFAGVFCVRD